MADQFTSTQTFGLEKVVSPDDPSKQATDEREPGAGAESAAPVGETTNGVRELGVQKPD